MNPTLVFNSSRFLLYVKVIGGLADGPIITIDARGHIHVVPDPRPLSGVALEKVEGAAEQLAAGVAAFQAAVAQHVGSEVAAH